MNTSTFFGSEHGLDDISTVPVLARQPSRAANPLLRSSQGGDPLCVLASGRWGPTYIASYSHTLGSWVDFYEVLQPLMWWRNR